MSKIPYIPIYIDDYEGHTAHLSLEEDGIYFRLIRLSWRTPGCSLPNDAKWIARRMRVSDAEYIEKIKPIITEFFTVKRGRILQKRLVSEFGKAKSNFEARSKAGKKGGRPKSLKNNETDKSGALSKRKQNESNQNQNHIKDIKGFFEVFWKAYPQRPSDSKVACLKTYTKYIKSGIDPDSIMQALSDYKYEDGFQKGTNAWLNLQLWENGSDNAPLTEDDKFKLPLETFRDKGIWYDDYGPKPTVDGKPDGLLNPDCKAPVELIKEILNRGDLI